MCENDHWEEIIEDKKRHLLNEMDKAHNVFKGKGINVK